MIKNRLNCTLHSLLASIKRLPQILIHPQTYFEGSSQSLLDGVLVVILLFLSTFCQKLLWVDAANARISSGWALEQAAVNSLLVWSMFVSIFYIVLVIFKKNINLAPLLAQIGAAGLPLVVVTLISVISWLGARLLGAPVTSPLWYTIQNILTWSGFAFSWTGLLGYFILQRGYNIKRLWAAIIPGTFFILLMIGWLISSN